MKKSTIYNLAIGVILLILMVFIQQLYKEVSQFGELKGILGYGTLLGTVYFTFGLLIEADKLRSILVHREYHVDKPLLILTMVLIILILIPYGYWIVWFGVGLLSSINPLIRPETKAIITVLTGILSVRSFYKKD